MEETFSVSNSRPERALLVGVQQQRLTAAQVADSLDELEQLATTAGAEIVDSITVRQKAPRAGTYIGTGKAEELAERAKGEDVALVVFDDDLTPAQGRNLEAILKVRLIDRTQMILDIFAQHARTREGALQIELAQLEYLIPRLRRMWTHLERQQGGIGLRGPGEKQLEMDRRRIQAQIARLRAELEQVRTRRAEQRRGRRRHGWALLTLVGYTNAGKSTLLNALTGADALAYGQLFATLDPTTRKLELPNRQMALLTDTVGFIRKLPHHLVESFKATLEEVNEADFLIHVIDASHSRAEQQVAAVQEVLRELGAEEKPVVCVLNKMDRPESAAEWRHLQGLVGQAVPVSAKTGEGLEALTHELADRLKDRHRTVRLRLPLSEGKLISDVRHRGKVFEEIFEDESVLIDVSLPPRLYARCARYELDED
jgi:GTP-binding protein HflX